MSKRNLTDVMELNILQEILADIDINRPVDAKRAHEATFSTLLKGTVS